MRPPPSPDVDGASTTQNRYSSEKPLVRPCCASACLIYRWGCNQQGGCFFFRPALRAFSTSPAKASVPPSRVLGLNSA